MNVGLSNLDTLKKQLFSGSLNGETRFDTIVAMIGLGMAARIESFCNRKLARMVGEVEICPADRVNFLLSRFPLEAITLIEVKLTEAAGWVAQDATFYNTIDLKNGMVICPDGSDPGDYFSQVRFTYTGGFFWEQLEPDDAAYPSQLPAGATALPEDLRLAWLLQCQTVWDQRDKLGIGLVDAPDTQSKTSEIKLSPLVRDMLGQYIRPQMT